MKRFGILLICISALFSTVRVEAKRHGLIMAPVNDDEYSWRITDAAQKKQAVGMTMTGFVFFVAIAVISGFVPGDFGSTAPTAQTQTETDNTILGAGN